MRFPGQDPEPARQYLSREDLQALLQLLQNALDKTNVEFESSIRRYQDIVWDNEYLCEDRESDEMLRDLAYDLEYYVCNPEHRRADTSYFDESEAKYRVRECLGKIRIEI